MIWSKHENISNMSKFLPILRTFEYMLSSKSENIPRKSESIWVSKVLLDQYLNQ